MDTLERLLSLIKERFDSDAAFERAAALKPKTVYKWRSGLNKSYTKNISRYAKVLETTSSYLLCETHHPRVELIPADPAKAKPTTPGEQPVLTEQQKLVNEIAEYLSKMDIAKLKAFKEVLGI